MKEKLAAWLATIEQPASALAFIVRLPNRTLLTKHLSSEFPASMVEQSLRCMAETFQVLTLHRSSAQRLCYVFEKVRIYAATSADGACLGLFLPISEKNFTAGKFAVLATEFSNAARQ